MNNSSEEFINNRAKIVSEQYTYWKYNFGSGVLRLLERLIFHFNVSDLLGGNLGQIAHLSEVREQIKRRVLVTPALLPRDSETSLDKVFDSTVPQYLLQLSNVNVDVLTGLPVLDSGFVVDGTLSKWQKIIYRGGIASTIKRTSRAREVIEEKSMVMPHTPYYYHAVVDELPNLLKVRSMDPRFDSVYVHQITPNWMIELLEAMNFRVNVTKKGALRFRDYGVLTAPRAINRQNLMLLSQDLRQELKNVIIVSRRGVPREDEIFEKALKARIPGALLLDPGTLSVREQIEIFSGASVIIGLHGGALTNLVWMSEMGTVVEVFNHSYRTSDYENLCHELNHRYLGIEYSNSDTAKTVSEIVDFINE